MLLASNVSIDEVLIQALWLDSFVETWIHLCHTSLSHTIFDELGLGDSTPVLPDELSQCFCHLPPCVRCELKDLQDFQLVEEASLPHPLPKCAFQIPGFLARSASHGASAAALATQPGPEVQETCKGIPAALTKSAASARRRSQPSFPERGTSHPPTVNSTTMLSVLRCWISSAL